MRRDLPIVYNEVNNSDVYGFSRVPEHIEKVPYGRFRNVYLYITDKCQLRCGHCYMGDRLDAANVMPYEQVLQNLTLWRKMGGSKLSILGGEPTLHPQFEQIVSFSNEIGYEKVILNTNGLASARRRLAGINPDEFAYIQVSLDGASPLTHDVVRGKGTFAQAWRTTAELCERGFDTRVICTVNRINLEECLDLLPMADAAGVSLVKYHVFSGIGNGGSNKGWLVSPTEWIDFYERLEEQKERYQTQIWFQPTYARRESLHRFAGEGFRGCIGRTLDRISVFSDGRAYVCSYLFDTQLNYAFVQENGIEINRGANEFDLFTSVLSKDSCGSCKSPSICMGGCPAEELALGGASCASEADVIPVCRLWKSKV